ncbi:hypothetical protein Bca101_018244 [Brassica carinata]
MTIFNWVQRKLHQNAIKEIDGAAKSEMDKRSQGTSEIEKNTKAILDQVGLVDAFDNWFDGVLTIGTFGFDTLKFQEEENEMHDDECVGVDLDYVVIDGSINKNVNQELDPLISNANKCYDHHEDLEVLDTGHFDSVTTFERPVVAATMEAKVESEKKRTTLAELFMEDEDKWNGKKKPKNPNLDGREIKYYKQNGTKLTSKFSFATKKMIIPKSKDKEEDSRPIKKVHDSRPIKKMHQMIKRMLQKKIHPDSNATKAFKKDVQYKPTHKCEALETHFLLQVYWHGRPLRWRRFNGGSLDLVANLCSEDDSVAVSSASQSSWRRSLFYRLSRESIGGGSFPRDGGSPGLFLSVVALLLTKLKMR